MKKVMNLTKAIGVLALLFLSQAMFAQKGGGNGPVSTTAVTVPTYVYVTPEAGITIVETKLYEVLGAIKQNQANPGSTAYNDAVLRDQYYRMVLGYFQEGYAPVDAARAAARKLHKSDSNIQLSVINTLLDEALVLLRA